MKLKAVARCHEQANLWLAFAAMAASGGAYHPSALFEILSASRVDNDNGWIEDFKEATGASAVLELIRRAWVRAMEWYNAIEDSNLLPLPSSMEFSFDPHPHMGGHSVSWVTSTGTEIVIRYATCRQGDHLSVTVVGEDESVLRRTKAAEEWIPEFAFFEVMDGGQERAIYGKLVPAVEAPCE